MIFLKDKRDRILQLIIIIPINFKFGIIVHKYVIAHNPYTNIHNGRNSKL